MLREKNNICIQQKKFFSCAIHKNDLYCISELDHILMKIDTTTGTIKYIQDPKEYNYLSWHLEDKMLSENGEIYALQLTGKHLMKYTIIKNECRYFEINCGAHLYNNYAAFTIHKGKAYIFPSYYNEVVIVKLETGEIEKKGNLCSDILFEFDGNTRYPSRLFTSGCQIENNIWLFMQKFNTIVVYNLDNNQIEKLKLPLQIHGCILAEWRDGRFYILDSDGKLYTWDIQMNRVKCLMEENIKKTYPEYALIIVTQNNVWLLPGLEKDIYVINKESKNMEKYIGYPKGFKYEMPEDRSKFAQYCEDESYYYFPLSSGNYILKIDKNTGKEEWLHPNWPSEEKRWEILVRREKFMLYEKNYSLTSYLDTVKYIKHNKIENRKTGISNNLWKIVKG